MASEKNALTPSNENVFEEVIAVIERARENAFRAVNR